MKGGSRVYIMLCMNIFRNKKGLYWVKIKSNKGIYFIG